MNVIEGLKQFFRFGSPQPTLPFSVLFKKFRSVLERNNSILELMADMGDKLGGDYVFDRQYVVDISEKVSDLVFKLISDLCVMNQCENVDLFIAFERIQYEIQEELSGRRAFPLTRPAILLDELNSDLDDEAGNKFANLGGGFEPPRPFGFGLAKFLASLALYSARIMAQAEQRIYSPWIRLCSAPLWFALFAKARSE